MKTRLGTLLLLIVLTISCSTIPKSTVKTISYSQAEYDHASLVLMHEPSNELFFGSLHPFAALFEEYIDHQKASAEHANYRDVLTKNGIEVITVREMLLRGCVDKQGEAVECPALDSLRSLALSALSYCSDDKELEAQENQKKASHIRQMSPLDLVQIILIQPTIHLSRTPHNTGLAASYSIQPVMNLFFMRDQMITTSKGVVIGRMNSPQRALECDIADFCIRKRGITPIARVEGEGSFLEGGDFIPFGNYAFIGCGMRTTQPAIDSLMRQDLLGCDTLVVVKDYWFNQAQMHLDTYFNVIDHDLATMWQGRLEAAKGDPKYLTADIYVRRNGHYRLSESDTSFVDFITRNLRIQIIPVSDQDQQTYANNFLTVGARHIMAVDGQSEQLKAAFEKHGVSVDWIPLNTLTKGYGAAHCMTQVLCRTSKSEN